MGLLNADNGKFLVKTGGDWLAVGKHGVGEREHCRVTHTLLVGLRVSATLLLWVVVMDAEHSVMLVLTSGGRRFSSESVSECVAVGGEVGQVLKFSSNVSVGFGGMVCGRGSICSTSDLVSTTEEHLRLEKG